MVVYSEKLFCDEKIAENRAKAMKKGIKGDYYYIKLPDGEENLLEIIETQYLRQSHYKDKEIFVVGIAKDKEAAEELTRRIIEACYREDSNLNIRRSFFGAE